MSAGRNLLLTLLLAMCCNFADAQTLSTQEVIHMPQAKADRRIAYGSDPLQFGDLRMPDSHPSKTSQTATPSHEKTARAGDPGGGAPNKFPVAIVIHGGCWSAEYDLGYMGNASAALTRAGIATWTIEYRRVGDTGGGWPGTFQDVAKAADYVRELAKQYPLDLKRVVAVGHSAGGHLALWLAARHKLPATSELYASKPIALRGVVSLAGIADLAQAGAENVCGDMAYQLMGGKPDTLASRYQQGSPSESLPLGVEQVLVHGESDKLVPHKLSVEYESRARKSGDDVKLVSIPGAGHFELVVPTANAWQQVEDSIVGILH
jgi:acetyl esterase/lipase